MVEMKVKVLTERNKKEGSRTMIRWDGMVMGSSGGGCLLLEVLNLQLSFVSCEKVRSSHILPYLSYCIFSPLPRLQLHLNKGNE